ncbi:hypothetical protein P171DRAFT_48216 [Karstenula rhodostoma CBS 690.94]|uniref:Uncharacterized protein n=1 Tax=Karstenula rhodostoma CBS 690.94 TaxID=1392251 RepID=A0A9P4PGG7_9PLEO|nr:hypothetical protein P171DRAFT_48216 [Karstenula rhodostoma CBS 690.94]
MRHWKAILPLFEAFATTSRRRDPRTRYRVRRGGPEAPPELATPPVVIIAGRAADGNVWRANVGVAPETPKRPPLLRSSAAGPTRSWMQVSRQRASLFALLFHKARPITRPWRDSEHHAARGNHPTSPSQNVHLHHHAQLRSRLAAGPPSILLEPMIIAAWP